ncbi:T9SS type A sorting domain-containing protein [Taibaiella lutea]|uniref:T9SS type A sorting domain-containing protein n=1 Tax=Taibaiella lutea TaxID=2608001 RepID=A0A5M6CQP0_9BACT|nr:T9SS type A sorting domain-containing protein [Taibaiella lutea]KAA5537457.1 T9SS type A sorting domain-containing protein [Taibaiella lutea]
MQNFFTKSICSLILLTMSGWVFQNKAFGQAANQYGFTAATGTYTSITGTAFSAVQGDDVCPAATIPLGFTFNFCGIDYTTIRAASNGYMTFSTTGANTLSNTANNLNVIKPSLMWLWDDLDGGGNIGAASYTTTGVVPNRVFTMEFKNWQWNWSSNVATISVQVKLYETTNVIEYIYRQEAAAGNPGSSGGASIGIADGSATATYLSLNNSTATPVASSTSFTTNINTKPATGQIYRFTPPVNCSAVTNLPASAATTVDPDTICISGNVTLGFVPVTPLPAMSGTSYRWQSSPAATGPWTNLGTTNFATPTYTTTTPVSTPLFFRCQLLCNSLTVLMTSTPTQVIIDNPGIPVIPADITQCGFGSVDLIADPGAGNTIRWFNSMTQATPVSTNNIYSTPYLTLDSNNTYVVYVASVNARGCEGVRKAINVDVYPKPAVDLGPDGNKCVDMGDGIVLDAAFQPDNPSFLWDDNSISQVRAVTASGTYYVQVTNSYGCIGSDTVNFTIVNNPVIDLSDDTLVCNGTTLTLDAGNDGIEYYWNTGQISQTIEVNSGGTYNVFVTNAGGCTAADTIQVTMQGELPSIGGINVVNNGQMLFHFTAVYPQNVVGYDWDFGDGSPHSYQASPIHEYENMGDYTVVLRLSSICGFTTDTLATHIVGIRQINLSNDELTVYPNPSNGHATIHNKANLEMEKIEVYNILGQLVYHSKADSKDKHVINFDSIAPGVYTIEVYTDKGTVARKLKIIK